LLNPNLDISHVDRECVAVYITKFINLYKDATVNLSKVKNIIRQYYRDRKAKIGGGKPKETEE